MNSNTRACIAYIIANLNTSNNLSSIYDYSKSKHINISGTIERDSINIYDYDRGCYLSGTIDNLYDYGNNAHIQLNIDNTTFSGYDFDSNKHFSGSINGNSISIYDYETLKHHNYSI